MNKRYLALIIIILFVTVGIFGWLFWKNKEQKEKQKSEAEKISQLLPGIECSFQNDGEANAKAIESKNPSYCSCVKDEKRKENCRRGVMDVNYYDQAIKQYDSRICTEIGEKSVRESCLSIVFSGIRSLKEKNPEQLAWIYISNGNFQEAETILAGLINAHPEKVENILAMAINYANRAIFEHKESELIPKALALVEKAEKLNSESPEVFRVKGFIFEAKSDLVGAIESYTKSINLDDNYILAYVGRGHAKNIFGDLNGALEDFNRAKELDAKKAEIDVYVNLCRLKSSRSDLFASAIEDCQTALGINGGNSLKKSEVLGILAEVYIKLGKFDEAEASAEKSLSYSPDDPNAFYLFARIKNIQGDYAKAEYFAKESLTRDSMKTVSYNALAFALYKQKKYEAAISAAQKGLNVIDGDVSLLSASKNAIRKELYLNMANAYGMSGDESKAEEYKKMSDKL